MSRFALVLVAALIAPTAWAQTPLPNGVPGLPKAAAPKVETPKVAAPTVETATAAKAATSALPGLPGQNFTDLALAEKTCGSKNAVVWLNPNSGKSFEPGNRYFGKTKDGAYACAADAAKSGFTGAKNKF